MSASEIVSVYGKYNPKWVKLGDQKTFPCTYDCPDTALSCTQTAIFSCVKDETDQLSFKAVYNCIRTTATKEYETLAGDEVL